MTSQQIHRTDALTALADKYNMTAGDRIKLFKIYLEAAQLPPGWVVVPEDPVLAQVHAGLHGEHQPHTASVWNMMKECMAAQYRRMIKARPAPPTRNDS